MTEVNATFGVLGALEVLVDGRAVVLRSLRQRALLALLVLEAARPVGTTQLAEVVWAEDRPRDARTALHSHVMRLRKRLGAAGALIRTEVGSYTLAVDRRACDVHRFRELVRGGMDDPEQLRRALSLWRDDALAGIDVEALAPYATALAEERLDVLERRIELELAAGRHAGLVAELAELVSRYPLRENFWAQLMIVLHRNGRQADALAAFERVRRILRDELGADPGPQLQTTHSVVLGAPTIDPVPAVGASAIPGPPPRPSSRTPRREEPDWRPQRQLPLDVATLVGRESVTARVGAALRDGARMTVVVLSGLAGVGKSALAIHVAHLVSSDFPDGQWYLRLGGGEGRPIAPEHLLDTALRLTGLDPSAIPGDLDARAALLRSRLADRRVLIVLDDAAAADQVEPLLPGTPGCAVLVTSRSQLPDLTVLHGALPIPLDVLPDAQSRLLLATMVDTERLDAEPAATDAVLRLCGHLPLALRIAGGNLAHHRGLGIAGYAQRLQRDGLAALSLAGSSVTVRAAFDASIASLTEDVRAALWTIGRAPSGELGAEAIAALLGHSRQRTDAILGELCASSLLSPTGLDRYRMHDLLRAHASASTTPRDVDSDARLATWYLQQVDAANDMAGFRTVARIPRPAPPAPAADVFPDAAAALDWLDRELPNLVDVVAHASAAGPARLAWELTDALRLFLHLHRHLDSWRRLVDHGLAAAESVGDDVAVGAMQHSAGQLAHHSGDQHGAQRWFTLAIERYRAGGFALGEAVLLNNIGVTHACFGQPREALDYQDRALAAYEAAGRADLAALTRANRCGSLILVGRLEDAAVEADAVLALPNPRSRFIALINRAAVRGLRGEWAAGHADAERAIEFGRRIGGVEGIASAQLELARRCLDLGRHTEAETLARSALELAGEIADQQRQTEALTALGVIQQATGRAAAAIDTLAAALILANGNFGEFLATALVASAAAQFRAGDAVSAEREGRRADETAAARGHVIEEVRACGLLAVVSTALGRTSQAGEYARRYHALVLRTGFVPAVHEIAPGTEPV